MPGKNKTTETGVSVTDFINSCVGKDVKKDDSFRLIALMREWSGFEPKMWGPTIIGFGSYHYKYASGREGDAPLIGFSPRKAEFSLYVIDHEQDNGELLASLGKHRIGKACIYFRKLDDLDLSTLERLCRKTIASICARYKCGLP